jgi:hypothetical protein
VTTWLGISTDVHERARLVVDLAGSRTTAAVDLLHGWVRHDPRAAAETMLALALMADRDKAIKAAHAAYNRGDRTPEVDAMEKTYQRARKRREREIRRDAA